MARGQWIPIKLCRSLLINHVLRSRSETYPAVDKLIRRRKEVKRPISREDQSMKILPTRTQCGGTQVRLKISAWRYEVVDHKKANATSYVLHRCPIRRLNKSLNKHQRVRKDNDNNNMLILGLCKTTGQTSPCVD